MNNMKQTIATIATNIADRLNTYVVNLSTTAAGKNTVIIHAGMSKGKINKAVRESIIDVFGIQACFGTNVVIDGSEATITFEIFKA